MGGFLRLMRSAGKGYYSSFEDVTMISSTLQDVGSLDYPVTGAHQFKSSTDWYILDKEIGRNR